ncbi:NERD domain-containing protein [Flavobacteriaceae bacterium]|mgnify:CR=1 FL=1|nr:NERD domain-containing protein [Flavobacteriaceae bacterium]MDC3181846.1 NERD domain-containing protein [Flavobacteriaceae bacterium]
MEIVIVIISIVIVFLVISSISESNRRERERELISSVTSLNRGTSSEKSLILQLLKSGIPPVTIYHDLIIKKDNDKFSQIDLVLVTSEGIIVFEVKDYSGWIFGSGNNTNWTQVLSYGKRKYKFYNPIKQNNNHISELRKTLKQFENIPFFSVIVFFGDCELKEINYVPKGTYLVKSHRVFEVLNLIKDEDYTQYTNKREVVDKLKELVSLGENTDYQKQHIENIKDMVGKERIFK